MSAAPVAAAGRAPVVSVGIVCDRNPDELLRLLQSVLGQSYPELEVLVFASSGARNGGEDSVTEETQDGRRIRELKGSTPSSRWQQCRELCAQASGEYFMWLHENAVMPTDFVEKCMTRFADGTDVELVAPRVEAFWEGRYWFRCQDYSSLGARAFLRLGDLVRITYTEHDALDHLCFGLFRRAALLDALWRPDGFMFGERLSLLFRVAERGSFHVAGDTRLDIANTRKCDLVRLSPRETARPRKYRWLGTRLERLAPLTANIIRTVARSDRLTLAEKSRLLLLCLANFLRCAAKGQSTRVQRF